MLQRGDVVLFKTGWDLYYVEGEEGEKYLAGFLVTQTYPGWASEGVHDLR